MENIKLFYEFVGNIVVTEDNHLLIESVLDAAQLLSGIDSHWTFARDINALPKKGYFQLTIEDDDGIPIPARRKYGQMPVPTFAMNGFEGGLTITP